MKDKKPVIVRALEALQKHGACTLEQLAQHADTTVSNLYNYMGTLKKKHGVVKTYEDGKGSVATYSIGEPRVTKKPKAAKKAKRKAAPARKARKAPRTLPPPTNGDARFAIDEGGKLGIEKDGEKLALEPDEFERLRGFIERTQPIWKVARA